MFRRSIFLVIGVLLLSLAAQAHIGSPDIYLDGKAGPYQLFVTVRMPLVIPGVADLEIRSANRSIRTVQAVPMPLLGPGAKFAPVADTLSRSLEDPQLYHGSLWMMAPGSWQIRIAVDGSEGPGHIAIPVPSAARMTKRMTTGLGLTLSLLGLFLVGAVIAMAGASVREARLAAGVSPDSRHLRSGRIAMTVAAAIVLLVLWGANRWWSAEATSYGAQVYKPLEARASLKNTGMLTLTLTDPGWLNDPYWRTLFHRSVDDLIPDHDHLMHLYAIRQPALDVVYHLHPDLTGPGVFQLALPSMPAGDYRLYADIVHANGFAETLTSGISLPHDMQGRSLAGDDAGAKTEPFRKTGLLPKDFLLPDGYRMQWMNVPSVLHARAPVLFRFRLTRPDGTAPPDMALYMGMLGHAAFVRSDGTTFAHVHPSGSISMAALMLAQSQDPGTGSTPQVGRGVGGAVPDGDTRNMDGMPMESGSLPNEVTFPYGFPESGQYRVFVQMKHGQTTETGIFDADVIPAPVSSS